MIHRYPSIGERPIILMCVRDLLQGNQVFCQMLLDTGADCTCFPAAYATAIGHDNHHPAVKTGITNGVGGSSKVYFHSVQMALIDPAKAKPGHFPVIWKSEMDKALFVEALNTKAGLLGRDVMEEWKGVTFKSTPKKTHSKWLIEIEL